MKASRLRRSAGAFLIALAATSAHAQEVGSRVREGSGSLGDPTSPSPDDSKPPTAPAPTNFREWLWSPFRQEADRDGPINTDRPTFTPANTVVTLGRVQFESGFTFNQTTAGPTRAAVYDFPELAVRVGIMDRIEFRTFWLGQTYTQTQAVRRGPSTQLAGPSDMEVGFKTQLFAGDPKRLYLPTTALITSIMAPTGGTSPYSAQTVQPYVNLIYGWSPTKKLSVGGSTGSLGMRAQAPLAGGPRADSFSRFSQSLVAFYTATERATLFYEYYAFAFTSAADNRPQHFMDAGLLYRLSPTSSSTSAPASASPAAPTTSSPARGSRSGSDA